MFQSGAGPFVAVAIAAALITSGCLGPLPGAPGESEEPVAVPGTAADRGSVQWGTGAAWRYAVSGSVVGEPYVAEFGVVATDEKSHRVASDDPRESARAVAGVAAPLVGWVDAATKAPYVNGAPRDLLGLQRQAGDSWEVVFMGTAFMLVKGGPKTIDDAPGHRVAGVSSQGTSLVATYNEQADWFGSLELRDKENRLLMGYRFVGPGSGDAVLESWHVLDSSGVSGYQNRMGHVEWRSSGEGDQLLIAVQVRDDKIVHHSGSGSTGSGGLLGQARDLLGGVLGAKTVSSSGALAGVTVLAPGDVRVLQERALEPGHTVQVTRDQAGVWHLFASTGGPSVELVVYQLQVTMHTG